MAALYDFRFLIRTVSFVGDLVITASGKGSILFEECKQMTYRDAQTHLAHLSKGQSQSHSAILSLKYRDDKKPRGWNGNSQNRINYEATSAAA